MTEITPLTPILPEYVAGEVLSRTSQLLHSSQLTSKTFTRRLPSGEGELTEIVIGEKSTGENPHVLLSTHGLGGVESEIIANITAEDTTNAEYAYHTELFTVADSLPTANLFAENLARLAFFVKDNGQPPTPGTVISIKGETDDENKFFLFTSNPLGVQESHSQIPVLSTAGFAVFATCVTALTEKEAELLREDGNFDRFVEFMKDLGDDAYAYIRPGFTGETEPMSNSDTQVSELETEKPE